ncbi:MAG: hypothetical protein ACI31D_05725, partial [Candidatus Limisoma sp.]
EQRTENPCVPGSIPGGTTQDGREFSSVFFVRRLDSVHREALQINRLLYFHFLVHVPKNGNRNR